MMEKEIRKKNEVYSEFFFVKVFLEWIDYEFIKNRVVNKETSV